MKPVMLLILLLVIPFALAADVSTMKEKELLEALEKKQLDEKDYPKLKAEQLTKEVLIKVPDLSKLKAEELANSKEFDFKSIGIDKDVTVTYAEGKLMHPKGGTFPASAGKDKDVQVTKDGFVIKTKKQQLTIDGALQAEVREGEIDTGKFGIIKTSDRKEVQLTKVSDDELQTNAPNAEVDVKGKAGKMIANPHDATMNIIKRPNGDFGVSVQQGKGISVTNRLGDNRIITTTVGQGNKYYAIDNNQKHGLDQGGTLVFDDGKTLHSLASDKHAIYVFEEGKLAKIVAGYQQPGAKATYNEVQNDKLVRSVSCNCGMTIYKEGAAWSDSDPGVRVELGDEHIDVHEQYMPNGGQLIIGANGAEAIITPDKVSVRKATQSYAPSPEQTIYAGRHEITLSPGGKTDVQRDMFRTMALDMKKQVELPKEQHGRGRTRKVQEAVQTGYISFDEPKVVQKFNQALTPGKPFEENLAKMTSFGGFDQETYNELVNYRAENEMKAAVEERTSAIDTVVWHTTAGPSAESAINEFIYGNRGVSSHFVIDRDGTIKYIVPLDKKANHAIDYNDRSIGIEMAGWPDGETAAQRVSALALMKSLRAQYPSIAIKSHKETEDERLGVGQKRRSDPGEKFMEFIRKNG